MRLRERAAPVVLAAGLATAAAFFAARRPKSREIVLHIEGARSELRRVDLVVEHEGDAAGGASWTFPDAPPRTVRTAVQVGPGDSTAFVTLEMRDGRRTVVSLPLITTGDSASLRVDVPERAP